MLTHDPVDLYSEWKKTKEWLDKDWAWQIEKSYDQFQESPCMRLLDANVAIYANGGEHTYRRPCQLLMEQIEIQPSEYAIDVETLQEILYFTSTPNEGNSIKGLG